MRFLSTLWKTSKPKPVLIINASEPLGTKERAEMIVTASIELADQYHILVIDPSIRSITIIDDYSHRTTILNPPELQRPAPPEPRRI